MLVSSVLSMHSAVFCFSSSKSPIYHLIGSRDCMYMSSEGNKRLKAVKDPYSLKYFEIMSVFGGYIVMDHNWFVHSTIFLVSSIGQLTSTQFLIMCGYIELRQIKIHLISLLY